VSSTELGVLVVDDSRDFCRTLTVVLNRIDGVRVVGVVHDVGAGLEGMASLRPDVVILDIRMPGRNGLHLLEQLYGTPDSPRVIVLTEHGSPPIRQRCMELGAEHVLTKGADVQLLVELLEGMRTAGTPDSRRGETQADEGGQA
jgi:DNA-binding NarL/FixJ family response regulator